MKIGIGITTTGKHEVRYDRYGGLSTAARDNHTVDPSIDDADYPFVVYASEKSSRTKAIAKQLQGTRWSDTGAALAQHVRENYHIDHVNKIRRQIIESLR